MWFKKKKVEERTPEKITAIIIVGLTAINNITGKEIRFTSCNNNGMYFISDKSFPKIKIFQRGEFDSPLYNLGYLIAELSNHSIIYIERKTVDIYC